jgi:Zn finger protein HypA/HybF involved in hydrogenase expression
MPLGPKETVDFGDAWNVRHQPPTLTASACFRESKGRLSCLSCHSPHAAVERRISAYDAACKSCHAATKHLRPVAGQACAGCHMPAVKVRQGLIFANHRIAIYSPADPLRPVSAKRQALP